MTRIIMNHLKQDSDNPQISRRLLALSSNIFYPFISSLTLCAINSELFETQAANFDCQQNAQSPFHFIKFILSED